MTLKDSVTSLAISQEMDRVGLEKGTTWWWCPIYELAFGPPQAKKPKPTGHRLRTIGVNDENCYSARTCAEGGDILPKIVESTIEGQLIQFEIMIIRPTDCRAPQWDILYISPLEGKDVLIEIGDDTLANCMGKMAIWLRKEGLL